MQVLKSPNLKLFNRTPICIRVEEHSIIFSCRRGDEKCSLKFHCRNNCPFCRLKKCLKNGMKPELVLSAKNIDKTEGTDSPNEERSNRSEVHSKQQNKYIKMASSIIFENYNGDEYLLKILKTNQLIISQTTLVNIMAIPNHVSRVIEKRIKEAESQPGITNPDILLVAQMELAFLDAKECVSFFTESVTMDKLIKSQEEGLHPAVVFTSIQVHPRLLTHPGKPIGGYLIVLF